MRRLVLVINTNLFFFSFFLFASASWSSLFTHLFKCLYTLNDIPQYLGTTYYICTPLYLLHNFRNRWWCLCLVLVVVYCFAYTPKVNLESKGEHENATPGPSFYNTAIVWLFLLLIPFFLVLSHFNKWGNECCDLCFADGGTKKLRSTIRRSTETGIAVEMRNRVTRQGSKDSTDGSTNSNSSDGTWVSTLQLAASSFILLHTFFFQFPLNCRFVFPTTRLGPESQFSDFLDGLGPAQIVGRQTLATPPMGMVAVINFLSLIHCIFIHYRCVIAVLGETSTYLIDGAFQEANTVKKCWIANDWGAKS